MVHAAIVPIPKFASPCKPPSHAKEQINDIIADHPDTAIHVMLDNFPAPQPPVTTTTATTDTIRPEMPGT
jgi:hypothetical protein